MSLSSFKSLKSKPKKEWKTRGQLEEERKAEQQPEQKKQKVDGMALYEKAAALAPTQPASSVDMGAAQPDGGELPPREEVCKKLRSRSQPVTLFGETDAQRVARLRLVESNTAAESLAPDAQNVFAKMMEQSDVDERSDPDLEALAKLVPETCDGIEDELLAHFLRLLRMGGEELAVRPEKEKKSLQGKKEKSIWKQSLVYILPLFRRLAARSLEPGILQPLGDILAALKERDYAKADNAYLLLAIGKAAWPMGVTSVGIHERAAREKISTGQTAHVLNDENQRKYIQSVKRLITFSQKHFPAGDGTATDWRT